eukprot:767335-Hanusia_phi.AAC.8
MLSSLAVQPNLCAGGLAFCCSIDCSTFGGPRLCPGSGGLQVLRGGGGECARRRDAAGKVLVCRDERVRTCKPVPLRPLPFHSRFYVSSEMQWRWVEFDVPAGFDGSEEKFVAFDSRLKVGRSGFQLHAGWCCGGARRGYARRTGMGGNEDSGPGMLCLSCWEAERGGSGAMLVLRERQGSLLPPPL